MKKQDPTKLIIEYEEARHEVAVLEKKRKALLDHCKKKNVLTDNIDICLYECYAELMQMLKDNPREGYTFDEVLYDGHANGKYCSNCKEAYRVKHQELFEAREKFGKVKRRLSWAAKRMIKETS